MKKLHYLESLAEIQHRIAEGVPKPRRPTYRGITFRSNLERRFAIHLDEMGEKWRYEPRVYGPRGRGYLPDFEILGAVQPTFIEVKPTRREVSGAKQKMSVIWETHPDALLMVACEEGCDFHGCYRGEEWTSWQERWVA